MTDLLNIQCSSHPLLCSPVGPAGWNAPLSGLLSCRSTNLSFSSRLSFSMNRVSVLLLRADHCFSSLLQTVYGHLLLFFFIVQQILKSYIAKSSIALEKLIYPLTGTQCKKVNSQ